MDSARLQAELLSHNMKLFLMPGCNTWPAFDTQLDARERDLSTASEEVASARSRSASCQQAREQLQEAVLQLESKLATSTAEVQALRTQLQVRGRAGRQRRGQPKHSQMCVCMTLIQVASATNTVPLRLCCSTGCAVVSAAECS